MSRNKILGYNSRIYGHQTTGGESIGNQIDLCREYIRTHYGDAATSAIFPA
jgi:hypothetical protein